MDTRRDSSILGEKLGCTRVIAVGNIISNGQIIPHGTKGTIMSQTIKHGSQVEATVRFDGYPKEVYTKIKHIKCGL